MHFIKNRIFMFSLALGSIMFFVVLVGVNMSSERNHSEGAPESSARRHKGPSMDPQELPGKHSAPAPALHRSGKIDHAMQGLAMQQDELSEKSQPLETEMADSQPQPLHIEDFQNPVDGDMLLKDQEADEDTISAQFEAQLDLFESTLSVEAPDPQWTSEAENALGNNFAQYAEAAIDSVDVECGNSLCRIDLVVAQDQNIDDVQHQLSDLIPWNGELFFSIDTSEGGGITIYAAREDHSLPKITDQAY